MTTAIQTLPMFSSMFDRKRQRKKTHRNLRRERTDLISLDDRMLKDIGITREMAIREARRSSLDTPTNWSRLM